MKATSPSKSVLDAAPKRATRTRKTDNHTNGNGTGPKLKQLDAQEFAWPEEEIRAIAAPTLLVMADSDAMRPEHMVELFRLLGGGVPGDLTGLPKSQLAVIPGATHVSLVTERADLLLAVSTAFLDAPMR